MEKILKAPEAEAPETVVNTDVAPEVTPEPEVTEDEATTEDSTSTTDYDALIEEEKKGGKPDPAKARERFEKKQTEPVADDEPDEEDEDRPMTRREAREFLAQQSHQTLIESNTERITDYSNEISDSDAQAEYVRTIHANRVWPANTSLREQIAESFAIADYKRVQSKNAELARTVRSQDTASHDSAVTHRDPQTGVAPKLDADMSASLKRAGYTFNNQNRRYEKPLPNGKLLVTTDGKNPTAV
jgi:hypothetical protein